MFIHLQSGTLHPEECARMMSSSQELQRRLAEVSCQRVKMECYVHG